jgi:nitrite reductase/ring-hydroxylating ferredoxin subunit
MAESDWLDAGPDDLRDGRMRGVRIEGAPVLLARVDGCLHAVGGLCTHQDALLEDGWLDGRVVRCPWHDGCFDVTTGEALVLPARLPLPLYDARVADDRVLVRRR